MREPFLISFLIGLSQTAAPHQQFLDFWDDLDSFVFEAFDLRSRVPWKMRRKLINRYEATRKVMQLYQNEGPCESSPIFELVEMHEFDETKTPSENIEILGEMINDWIQSYACTKTSRHNKILKRSLKFLTRLKNLAAVNEFINRDLSIFTSRDELEFTEAAAYCHLENGWLADPYFREEYELIKSNYDESKIYWFDRRRPEACAKIGHKLFMFFENADCNAKSHALCMSGQRKTQPPTGPSQIMDPSGLTLSDINILMIGNNLREAFIFSGDGSTKSEAEIEGPASNYPRFK
ncbi:Oidioi.mRNA.OKI2018_I69.chr1.g3702.t1.cds [Oikopleura dioica]|uniref:Oidioi.mRNA.OKI2018_I69.chr1.g3702.t1.cds n=1 Tax=Oikopleura dioica TaxID=34765 RepID=A0ABN7T0H0_OIKDI|nr:Oidioi.mRNA.OKI2018_I69.chr1.g3702.t1.cds [Oikopleura dioica]